MCSNIIDQIGIEITAAFFPNRIYALTVSDYKRNNFYIEKQNYIIYGLS
jgi:hypothetical protein